MRSASAGEPGSRTWSVTVLANQAAAVPARAGAGLIGEFESSRYGESAAPARADGAELIGEFESSGYRVPPALIRRGDGQVVRLPPLLYEVAKQLDGRKGLPCLAGAVAQETGIELTAGQVGYLVDHKLAPLGISTYCDGSPPAAAKANPFLRLRFRIGIIPERAASFIGGLFAWLHHPVAVFLGVLAAVIGEGWLLTFQSVPAVVGQVLSTPSGIVLVFGLGIASTAFHEVGHASACRYSGAKTGKMGCGIYLIWPVFYTDITDSYRLGRAGRLRTDLGGVYFNGLFIAALIAGYRLTGFAPLAAAVIVINLEIIQQLLPSVRFDGYYIISDLIGVPDLFRYIAPTVKRVLRRKPDQRLEALRRWPKIFIGIWVFGVIPLLLTQLGILIWHLPQFLTTSEQTASVMLRAAQSAAGNGNLLAVASASLQTVFAILPPAGITLLVLRTLIGLAKFTRRRLRGGTAVASATTSAAAVPAAASAGGTRAQAARGGHAGVPARGRWATASRGRHAADR